MDKAHKVAGIVGMVLAAVCLALSQDAQAPDMVRHYAGTLSSVLAILGFGVTRPVFGSGVVATVAKEEEKK